jgi:hypothetical protein
MMRDGLTAGAAHVILDLKPGGGTELMQRAAAGGTTTFVAGTTAPVPYWLKLVRSGITIVGYQSSDGSVWTQVGSTSISMSPTLNVGLVVCSHDNAVLNTSTFESATVSGPASTYSALTDTNAHAIPTPPPALGGAGYTFNDPTFSSKILRVTDANTRPGVQNRSYRVPSNAHLNAWNTTSTYFYVISTDGTVIPYAFNPATMAASRINPVGSGEGGLTLATYVEPQFSVVSVNLIYCIPNTGLRRTITQYNFSNGSTTTVVDLDTVVAGLSLDSFVGGLSSGAGTNGENLLTFFGGSGQDAHFYAMWYPIANPGARKILNTVTSTINGTVNATNLNFHLHSASVDKSGRFVFLNPPDADLRPPRSAEQVYVWDTSTDVITPVTASMLPAGHDAQGYGYWANQQCCTSSPTYDGAQWQFRSLAALTMKRDLINPVLGPPQETYWADHASWNNASVANPLVPFISGTYRYNGNTTFRAWDEEIIGVQTNGPEGARATVWRFAHHQSYIGKDTNPTQPSFWYEPITNVSPDGLWVLFTSNWGKGLGTDVGSPDPDTQARQDVFLVQLTPGGGGSGAQNVIWTNVRNATATGNTLQKTSGCDGCQDAGGVSQQAIASGNGYVQFAPVVNAAAGPSLYVGLGSGLSTPPGASQINYAFDIWPGGTYAITESGVWKHDGTWAVGDSFKVAIEAGQVKYYQGGGAQPVYTSGTAPTLYPYVLGTTLFNVGVSVSNAVIKTP